MADNPNPQLEASEETPQRTLAQRRKQWLTILAAAVIGVALL